MHDRRSATTFKRRVAHVSWSTHSVNEHNPYKSITPEPHFSPAAAPIARRSRPAHCPRKGDGRRRLRPSSDGCRRIHGGRSVKACKLPIVMSARIARICVLIAMTLGTTLTARAADPVSYRVDLDSASDRAMDATLRATSELLSLRTDAPFSPFGLTARPLA